IKSKNVADVVQRVRPGVSSKQQHLADRSWFEGPFQLELQRLVIRVCRGSANGSRSDLRLEPRSRCRVHDWIHVYRAIEMVGHGSNIGCIPDEVIRQLAFKTQ